MIPDSDTVLIWNSLPVELRAPDISQTVFRNKLKTYLNFIVSRIPVS